VILSKNGVKLGKVEEFKFIEDYRVEVVMVIDSHFDFLKDEDKLEFSIGSTGMFEPCMYIMLENDIP
jgi:sporulation protein YlmC with PRC-barrel domain